ncbi:hypothetical protein BV20DRAFT_610243 [Pilatotrama ljubarskyi]|nr:hypothetical protein BV20DRAFT_610243 [Pilatotrama ljubarskyi]
MADYRFRDIAPRPIASKPDPLRETLSRLGLTEEQFKAKQTEMMEVLLRNQPFQPKEPPQQIKAPPKLSTAFYDHVLALSGQQSRGRSGSVSSSSSSRGPSPVPRTPARKDHGDTAPPPPRDQMELIIEQRNRAKEGRRRGVYLARCGHTSTAQARLFVKHPHRVNAKRHAPTQLQHMLRRVNSRAT